MERKIKAFSDEEQKTKQNKNKNKGKDIMKILRKTIGAGALALMCALPQVTFGSLVSLPTGTSGLSLSGANITTATVASWGAALGSMSSSFNNGIISGTLLSQVFNGNGGLAFVYTLTRTGVIDPIEHLTVGGFGGQNSLLVGNVTGGGAIAATTTDRTIASVVSFDGLLLGANSWEVVIQTTATQWGNATAGVIDSGGITVNALSVPEPTTMVAGAMLLLPFGMSTLRILRRKSSV